MKTRQAPILLPVPSPLRRLTATYQCQATEFLAASELAAQRMTAFGTGWKLDGHNSVTLFLRAPPGQPQVWPFDREAEFEWRVRDDQVELSVSTRSSSLAEIFQAFKGELARLLPGSQQAPEHV